MKHYVLGFYLTPDGAILIRKTIPAWQEGYWNGLGGSIEPGESAVDAMVREFAEESGIVTTPADWMERLTLSGKNKQDELWQMTVFSTFGFPDISHLPRDMEEGYVTLKQNMPWPMDKTADWSLRMCWDLHRHELEIVSASRVPA